MDRLSASNLLVIAALTLACTGGRAHRKELDTDHQECSLDALIPYCEGPAIGEDTACPEGDVRVNCTAVVTDRYNGPPNTLEEDRCASAEFIQSICGEEIFCSVASNDTIYLSCGTWEDY